MIFETTNVSIILQQFKKDPIGIIKGIFSDSNITFLWHKSEDINKKRLFPKIKLISIFHEQVMQDNAHWPCSIDYCVK